MSQDLAGAPATWDRLAARYGAQERFEARALAALVALADPGPGDLVVDLGTGTGAVLRALANQPDRPREAVGVDRSRAMLGQVRDLPAHWRTIHADAAAVPLPDGVAGVVTCSYVLHLLAPPERARVLAEARRLLAPEPGSRLVLSTVWTDPATPGGRALAVVLRSLARARPRDWGGLCPLDPRPELAAAGLAASHTMVLKRGGYPSLIVAAHASDGRPAATASG